MLSACSFLTFKAWYIKSLIFKMPKCLTKLLIDLQNIYAHFLWWNRLNSHSINIGKKYSLWIIWLMCFLLSSPLYIHILIIHAQLPITIKYIHSYLYSKNICSTYVQLSWKEKNNFTVFFDPFHRILNKNL